MSHGKAANQFRAFQAHWKMQACDSEVPCIVSAVEPVQPVFF